MAGTMINPGLLTRRTAMHTPIIGLYLLDSAESRSTNCRAHEPGAAPQPK
jgi:hypothetical protein